MLSRRKTAKTSRMRRKVAIVIVSLTVAVTATTGMVFADTDIAGTLRAWFDKKTETAMNDLAQSVQSETDLQKTRLKEELRIRLDASAKELDVYTEEQQRLYKEAIDQYADSLVAGMNIDNGQDRQQIRSKLQTIADSAKAAMDALSGSYVPPTPTFEPPAATSVADAVYGTTP